jgi:hypothetical protein
MHALLIVLAVAAEPHPINAVVGDASVVAGYVAPDATRTAGSQAI